jgi:hypothetical protein
VTIRKALGDSGRVVRLHLRESNPAQRLRQLADVRRDPPRLILGGQLGLKGVVLSD